jgi:hypothetical protein
MPKWFARLRSASNSSAKAGDGFRMNDAKMQVAASGRLPEDVVAGGRTREPSPEYIGEAAEPSEEVWAHEEELYRRRREQEESGS